MTQPPDRARRKANAAGGQVQPLDSTLLAKKRDELFDREARRPNQRAQGSVRDLSMIRNGEAAMGRLGMPEDDVAALLAILTCLGSSDQSE